MAEIQKKSATEKHRCVRCGVETDNHIGDVYICETCYEVRSSCCPEFGADDLTDQGDSDEKDARQD